ncbi:MAG: DNA repair protein RecO [Candidatus Firestonebacteria bacterium]
MPLYKTQAIVVNSVNFGEANRILTLYTFKFGKIQAVVKGIRKIKSRFGSSMELFTNCTLMLYRKEGKELYTVTQVEVINSLRFLKENLKKMVFGSYILEILLHFVPAEEKNEELYNLLIKTLINIEKKDYVEKIALTFAIQLLSIAGYKMRTDVCVICKTKPLDKGSLGLSYVFGGILCAKCSLNDEEALSISQDIFKTIKNVYKANIDTENSMNTNTDLTMETILLLNVFFENIVERKFKVPAVLKKLAIAF